jgi:predicted nucleic acid-binding protein
MPQLIIDTNGVLSALLIAHVQLPSYRVVRAVMEGALHAVVSQALVDEYYDVLARPDVARRHRQTPARVGLFLGELLRDARHVEPPATLMRAPDAADQHLWDLLAFIPDAIIITGDRKLLNSGDFPRAIESPREFADRYGL